MTAIGWRKRGGSKPLKFTKEKHMSTEAEKQEPACPHIDEPLGCYRVRCQLGRKCVERTWVGLTDEEIKFEAQYLCNSYYLENPERLLLLVRTIEAKLKEKNG